MYKLNYYYRSPHAIYFSLEKLFKNISLTVSRKYPAEFTVEETTLPLPTKWKSILPNMSFVRKRQADINHITGDVHYAIIACRKADVNILTVHDCVLLHNFSRRSLRYWIFKWLWYDWPVWKADGITVISENTRKELLHFTNCDPAKITVIADFVDPVFKPIPFRFKNNKPLVLFIGSTLNKNLERLIEAMEGLDAELDIIGFLNGEQKEKLLRHGIKYYQSSGVTQEVLLEKYAQCDILAFPSTYEGFGLPIIEAQATGRPVLTSNLSPMREVAGQGASLVDPYDVSSIRRGLLNIIENEAYREKIIAEGFVNVARFQLDRITDEYVNLYRLLLRRKKTIKS